MFWIMKLAARVRRHLRPRLRDLESRVAELERRLAVPSSGVRGNPALDTGSRRARARELLAQGVSQAETARRLGVSRQYINHLVRGGL